MIDDFHYTVLEFIRESGFIALHVRKSGEYDPAQGGVVEIVKTTPIEAIIMDATLQSNGLGSKLNTDIQAGDKQMFVRPPHITRPGTPVLTIDPTKDRVKVGTIDYKIVTTKEINTTGNDPILYEFYLRR